MWTRWYPTGVKRVQAEFREGLQDGSLIAWDDTGMLVHEGHFEQGAPADQ